MESPHNGLKHQLQIIARFILCYGIFLPLLSFADPSQDLLKAVKEHNPEGMKTAITAGADVNKADDAGNTPLCCAILWPDEVKILIDSKADVNLKSKSGLSPIMSAATFGETESIRLLLAAKADVKATNAIGQSALGLAAFNGSQAGALKALLDAGADINAKDALGQTALFQLSAYGKTPSERVATVKTQAPFLQKAGLALPDRFTNPKDSDYSTVGEMMKVLLDAGANPNAEGAAGFTPLMWAAKNNRVDAIRLLLDAKADPNKQDVSKHGSLSFAADAGSVEAVKMLVAAGADVNAETWDLDMKTKNMTKGFTPLTRAAMNNQTEVVQTLLGLGAKPDMEVSGYGYTNPSWGVPCLYKMSGKTAIMYAAENNNLPMVKMLVEAKCDFKKHMKWSFEQDCNINVDFTSAEGIAKSLKYDDIKEYLGSK